MPTLIVIGPKLAVREYELKSALTIGRHESNAIQLTEEKASRAHCSVRLENGRAIVEDLNSANGVFVNGVRVASQVLQHNDRITIGVTTLVFCDKNAAEILTDTKVLVAAISSQLNAIIPDNLVLESDETKEREAVGQARQVREGRQVAQMPQDVTHTIAPTRPARAPRRLNRSADDHHMAAFAVGFLIVGVVAVLIWQAQPPTPIPIEPETRVAQQKALAKARETEALAETQLAVRPADPRPAPNVMPVVEAPHLSLDEQLIAALAARDRALGSGNLLGAKAALQSFLASVSADQSNDESVRRARHELDETTKVATAALDMSLGQAREALTARHFHLVSQRCTNLISNDPNGPFGKQAREMLEGIDDQTAQDAATAKTKALDAVGRGQLGQARAAVESVMGELAGTRWAADIDALQFQLIVASGLLEKAEAARSKLMAAGGSIYLTFPTKKINGRLLSLNGLQARIRAGEEQVEMPMNLKNLETKDFAAMLGTLGLSEHFDELACLWSVLGRPDAARSASEAALKKPGDSPIAATLAGLLTNSKNVHLYDFKGWRQQLDWEAVSGSWLSQDGKYVLETPDGGETALKPASIGGAFPFEASRVSFEFEIRKPSAGWFFVCELGNETQAVVLTFSEAGVVLQDKSGAKSPPVTWTETASRVDIAIDGDSVSLTLDGKAAATLSAPRIAKQKGTIAFKARQCACAIDNVILRSQE